MVATRYVVDGERTYQADHRYLWNWKNYCCFYKYPERGRSMDAECHWQEAPETKTHLKRLQKKVHSTQFVARVRD